MSGVLHGTVLNPLLFSLHINDIMSDIESEIRLLADDCVCFREIKDMQDALKLQKDSHLGQEMEYGTSTSHMQHDAADKNITKSRLLIP